MQPAAINNIPGVCMYEWAGGSGFCARAHAKIEIGLRQDS